MYTYLHIHRETHTYILILGRCESLSGTRTESCQGFRGKTPEKCKHFNA